MLTARAEWPPAALGDDIDLLADERPVGAFSRQLFLGESLDARNITAGYDAGVLTLPISIVPSAKPLFAMPPGPWRSLGVERREAAVWRVVADVLGAAASDW